MNGKIEYRENRKGELEIVRGTDAVKVAIPDEVDGKPVTAVRMNAFRNCSNIREVTFGSNIRTVGRNAFQNCTSLRKAVLGNISFDLTSFRGCTSLESYEISGSEELISIRGAVYTKDRKLLIWPSGKRDAVAAVENGTKTVCRGAFTDCQHVRCISFPSTVESIEDGFAAGCTELEAYEVANYAFATVDGVLYRKDRLISCPPALMTRRVAVQPKTSVIAEGAFRDCRYISEIVLGSEVSEIGAGAFAGMSSLRGITVPAWIKADLPFDFLDGNMNVLERDEVPGHSYVLRKGKFVMDDSRPAPMREEGRRHELGRLMPSMQERSKFEPVKITGITFDDIAGHEEVKQEILDRLVLPAENAELFGKYGLKAGGGVLMYGPPGTGKTMLAQAVACQLGAPFFSVKASDLLNKFVGNTEANVKALFEKARSYPRAVIFFDDFDSIGRSRNAAGSRPWVDGLVNELLTQMQGVEQYRGTLLVLAATNRPWNIDSALTRPGRFDILIHVPLPDSRGRAEIFRLNLGKCPCEELDYDELSDCTEGYSAADIASVCRYAKLAAVKRSIASGREEPVTMDDVIEAAETIPSSVSSDDLVDIDAFEETGHPAVRVNPEEMPYIPGDEEELAGYL